MLTAKTIAGGALLMVLAASTASAQVQLSIRDGRVTLVATNATVRQILTEWARIGQTKIVNVERIPGGPLTLQFMEVPEAEALDILLRSVTGYLAAPRPVPVANLSHYDRILVLATAATPRVPVAAGPTPVVQRPQVPQPTPEADDDVPSIVQPPRGPLFPTFQLPQQGNQQPQQGGASATPGAFPPPPLGVDQRGVTGGVPPTGLPASGPFVVYPGGSSVGTPRPGMVVQPPAQPGTFQPGQPRQPGQPAPSPDN